MEIKKGDRFECIKTVIMPGSGEEAYTRGNTYVSELDGCVTDNGGFVGNTGGEYFWREHFRRIKDVSTEAHGDPVNHPPHYTQGKVESIDAIESALGVTGFEGFLAGNAMKYIYRYRHKNGLVDLKKAQFYLDKLIVMLSEKPD